jgi:hypothetical protein
MPPISHDDLEARLARLEALSRDDLAQAWTKALGTPAPHKASRELLIKAVAHQLQCRLHGELKPASRKLLLRIARAVGTGTEVRLACAPPPAIKPGTRLIRAYRGETHEVVVAADGAFEWRGKRYRSLSHIAREITGCRRNGPAFFGLRESGLARPSGRDDRIGVALPTTGDHGAPGLARRGARERAAKGRRPRALEQELGRASTNTVISDKGLTAAEIAP